ncbi:MAG: TRAP transporter small permease [Betaproteobacteria bacterium]|nr:TRAP transporter small permease [Betaproteobacteria bacterium]MBL8533462.1 TRAP transporter small permease [Betaproteobacteria bacterium]
MGSVANRILDRIEEWLIATLIATATLIIFLSVLHRFSARIDWVWEHTSQYDLTWAQELCIILFIWMAKFGAAYGVRTGIHIGVDLLVSRSGPVWQRRLVTLALLLGAVFTSTIAVLGARWVMFMHETGQVTPDLEWPRWAVYLCIPLGSGLMCFRFLQVLYRYRRDGSLPSHSSFSQGAGEETAA